MTDLWQNTLNIPMLVLLTTKQQITLAIIGSDINHWYKIKSLGRSPFYSKHVFFIQSVLHIHDFGILSTQSISKRILVRKEGNLTKVARQKSVVVYSKDCQSVFGQIYNIIIKHL